ncbi:TPA: hypothetical protein ENS27_01750, partial [bacterium]|nr:hypothetical protein [bacterium]
MKKFCICKLSLIILIMFLSAITNVVSDTNSSCYEDDDWTQFRSDANRSGYTDNELPSSLGV